MEEFWTQLRDFPDYSISTFGRIRNDNRDRIVKTSTTQQGAEKVGLFYEGRQVTRAVRVLVAETFIANSNPLFNTPINLDGNQTNNYVDNLMWRPRWFAWKYHRQFEVVDGYYVMSFYHEQGPLKNRKTEEVYDNVIDAAIANGLLCYEVYMSALTKIPVFPSWHIYDWHH